MANCPAALWLYGNSVDPPVLVPCSLVEHEGEHQAVGGTATYQRVGERREAVRHRLRGVLAGYAIRWSDPPDEPTGGDDGLA